MISKKTISRIVPIVLGVCLLAGCAPNTGGRADNTANVPGMFVQTSVSPLGEMNFHSSSLARYQDGTIAFTCVDEQIIPRAFMGDGRGEWTEQINEAAREIYAGFMDRGQYVLFTVADDGAWWLAPDPSTHEDEALDALLLTRVDKNGGRQEIEIELPDGVTKGYMVNMLVPANDGAVGMLLIGGMDVEDTTAYWLVVDSRGSLVFTISLNTMISHCYKAVVREGILYIPQNGNELASYSLQNGKLLGVRTIPALNFGTENTLFDVAANGDFCYVTRSGISRLAEGSSVVQDVVVGTQYVFAGAQYMGLNLLALEDGGYILSSDSNGRSSLCLLEFDEDASLGDVVTLSLWALEETHLVRAAVSTFGELNPDIYIDAEYGRPLGGSPLTTDDIIRTLNTRIVAGNVPDILILDGLPVDAYINQGVLLDLAGKVNTDGCYENLMTAFARDDAVYAYPTLFKMPVLVAWQGAQPVGQPLSLKDLAALAQGTDQLYYGNYLEMLEALYLPYSNRIFPNGNAVEEGELREFLLQTGEIAKAIGLSKEIEYYHGGMSTEGIYPRQGIAKYIEGGTAYAADILWEPIQVLTMFGFHTPQEIIPLPGAAYIPVGAAAVTAASPHQQQALSFVQSMLAGDNVQNLNMEQGFSVTIGRHQQAYERRREEGRASPADFDWDALTQAFVGGPAITEAVLQEKLYEVAEGYYENEISLEDAIEQILQSTRLYFEERK